MANFSALKQAIQNNIKQNGNKEITGNLLQTILLSMVTTMGDGAINDLDGEVATSVQFIDGKIVFKNAANTVVYQLDTNTFLNDIETRIDAGAVYAGYATPSTTPAALTGQKVFYVATQAGTYTHFHFNGGNDGITLAKDGVYFIESGLDADDWNATTIMQLDDVPTPSSNNAVKSGGVAEELALGAVYDVSAKNPTAGPNNDGKWESLSALLSDANINTLIPTAYRKGGMSIKFVHSVDNKYIQARLMANSFTTDVTKWQVVDAEIIPESKNLTEGGAISKTEQKSYDSIASLDAQLNGETSDINTSFKPNAMLNNKVEQYSSTYSLSEYIDISAFDSIKFSACIRSSQGSQIGAVIYDSDKEPVRMVVSQEYGSAGYETITTVIQSGEKYIRVLRYMDNTIGTFFIKGINANYISKQIVQLQNNTSVNKEQIRTNSDSIANTEADIHGESSSINTSFESNKQLNNKVEQYSDTYALSEYIDISRFNKIRFAAVKRLSQGSQISAVTYNTNKEPLRMVVSSEYGTQGYETLTTIVQNGEKYIRVLKYMDDSIGTFFIHGIKTDYISQKITQLQNNTDANRAQINLVNKYLSDDYTYAINIIKTNVIGDVCTFETITSTHYHLVLDCNPGDLFFINGSSGADTGRLWAFVDSNNVILSCSEAFATLTGYITAPANAVKAIFHTSDNNKKAYRIDNPIIKGKKIIQLSYIGGKVSEYPEEGYMVRVTNNDIRHRTYKGSWINDNFSKDVIYIYNNNLYLWDGYNLQSICDNILEIITGYYSISNGTYDSTSTTRVTTTLVHGSCYIETNNGYIIHSVIKVSRERSYISTLLTNNDSNRVFADVNNDGGYCYINFAKEDGSAINKSESIVKKFISGGDYVSWKSSNTIIEKNIKAMKIGNANISSVEGSINATANSTAFRINVENVYALSFKTRAFGGDFGLAFYDASMTYISGIHTRNERVVTTFLVPSNAVWCQYSGSILDETFNQKPTVQFKDKDLINQRLDYNNFNKNNNRETISIHFPQTDFVEITEINNSLPYYTAGQQAFDGYYALYDELVQLYPNYVSKISCDDEVVAAGIEKPSYMNGYPIYMYKFSAPSTDNNRNVRPIKVLIDTATHPEYMAIYDCYCTMKHICEMWQTNKSYRALKFNVDFYIIPLSNPYAIKTGDHTKCNYNGVDLNRNMPVYDFRVSGVGTEEYTGPSAGSEYESKVQVYYINSIKPDLFIDHHNSFVNTSGNMTWMDFTSDYFMGESKNFALEETLKITNKYNVTFPAFDTLNKALISFKSNWLEYRNGRGYRSQYAEQQGVLSSVIETYQYNCWKNGILYDEYKDANSPQLVSIATNIFTNFLIMICNTISQKGLKQ